MFLRTTRAKARTGICDAMVDCAGQHATLEEVYGLGSAHASAGQADGDSKEIGRFHFSLLVYLAI